MLSSVPAVDAEVRVSGHHARARELFSHADQAGIGQGYDVVTPIQLINAYAALANGGTLFLDEVGELPLHLQPKLLRLIQEREVTPVGAARPISVNVRFIASTNRNLARSSVEGRFRSDLYHRLAIFPIHLPPLRERREDIPLLAAYAVTRKAQRLGRKIERIPNAILDRLAGYDWPGNVRELENVLERAIILSPGNSLRLEAIQLGSAAHARTRERTPAPEIRAQSAQDDTLQAHERAHILRICQATAWKIKGADGAAKALGLNPATLYSRMKKLGIPTRHARQEAG